MSATILSLLPLLSLLESIKSTSINSTLPRRAKSVEKSVKKFQPFFSSGRDTSRFLSLDRNSNLEENSDFVWVPFANSGLFTSESDIDNMEDFREVWLNSPNQIIWRRCGDCTSEDHKNIFYRRWDNNGDLPEDLDLIDLLKNNWFSSPRIQGNDFNVHFSLYSSYEDAVNDQNRWTYCNFNDPTVGFPRDCSPSSYTPFQWNSFIRTDGLEKKDVGFYIESRPSACSPNQMKVDVSVTTDQYPQDTHWVIESSNGETFTFSSPDPMNSVESTLCLDASDCHDFFIYDEWGDGLREGNFSVTVDDERIVLSNPHQPFTSLTVELCKTTESPSTSPSTSLSQEAFVEVKSDNCEMFGLETVTSEDECSQAAEYLGRNVVWGPNGGYQDVVTGCSARFDSQSTHLFFNMPGVCDPTVNLEQWTFTGCKCADWMPCLCREPDLATECDVDQMSIDISVTTDNYPSETSWTLTSDGDLLRKSFQFSETYSTYNSRVCVENSRCYIFNILDSWGDGLFEGGGFVVEVDGEEVLSNPGTDAFSSLEIEIGDCNTNPTTSSSLIVQSSRNITEAQDGKIAILSLDEINDLFTTYSKVENGDDIFNKAHIKENQGLVVRAKNHRSGKEGGFMIWANDTEAFGTWNPREFGQVNDFLEDDNVELLVDFDKVFDKTIAQNVNYTLLTGTGWNLPAEGIRFGQCGLVGDWWRELEVQYELETSDEVVGIYTDSIELMYEIKYEDAHGEWQFYSSDNTGTTLFDTPIVAKKWRLFWNTTDMFQTGGLSTYRGGGGLHAELLL